MNSTHIRLRNKIIQKIAHKKESIEKIPKTRTYTSKIKNLLKSTVLIYTSVSQLLKQAITHGPISY